MGQEHSYRIRVNLEVHSESLSHFVRIEFSICDETEPHMYIHLSRSHFEFFNSPVLYGILADVPDT